MEPGGGARGRDGAGRGRSGAAAAGSARGTRAEPAVHWAQRPRAGHPSPRGAGPEAARPTTWSPSVRGQVAARLPRASGVGAKPEGPGVQPPARPCAWPSGRSREPGAWVPVGAVSGTESWSGLRGDPSILSPVRHLRVPKDCGCFPRVPQHQASAAPAFPPRITEA